MNEVITESFSRNDGNWDCHFNDLTWYFIELVAGEIVDEYESTTCEEESNSNALQYAMFGSTL